MQEPVLLLQNRQMNHLFPKWRLGISHFTCIISNLQNCVRFLYSFCKWRCWASIKVKRLTERPYRSKQESWNAGLRSRCSSFVMMWSHPKRHKTRCLKMLLEMKAVQRIHGPKIETWIILGGRAFLFSIGNEIIQYINQDKRWYLPPGTLHSSLETFMNH